MNEIYKSEGFISKFEIKSKTESTANTDQMINSFHQFPEKLHGLKWENIKRLSILTGKNGAGKSKILKLLLSAFNNNDFKKKFQLIKI
jgi:hypothetical protein